MTETESVAPDVAGDNSRSSGFRAFVMILGLLIVGVSYARSRFGSVPAVIDFLQGKSIHVSDSSKLVGGVPAGTTVDVRYAFTNLSDRPIRLIGATYSCTCTVIQDMPMTLAPSETKTVSVRVTI